MDHLPHLDAAYVGLINETGSLFAMSPDRFPLVVFSDADPEVNTGHQPIRTWETCRTGSSDRNCLTGIRPLASDSRSRFSRLLDGAPTVELPPVHDHTLFDNGDIDGGNNLSIVPTWVWGLGGNNSSSGRDVPLGLDGRVGVFSTIGSVMSALLLGLIWVMYRKARLSKHAQVPVKPNGVGVPIAPVDQQPSADSPSESKTSIQNEAVVPVAVKDLGVGTEIIRAQPNGHPIAENNTSDETRDDGNDGDESDKDYEGAALPNKRKGRRGKRGKKKKVIVVTEDDAVKIDTTEKPINGGASFEHMEPPLIDDPVPLTALAIPLTARPGSDPPPPATLLVVSDTILGENFPLRLLAPELNVCCVQDMAPTVLSYSKDHCRVDPLRSSDCLRISSLSHPGRSAFFRNPTTTQTSSGITTKRRMPASYILPWSSAQRPSQTSSKTPTNSPISPLRSTRNAPCDRSPRVFGTCTV